MKVVHGSCSSRLNESWLGSRPSRVRDLSSALALGACGSLLALFAVLAAPLPGVTFDENARFDNSEAYSVADWFVGSDAHEFSAMRTPLDFTRFLSRHAGLRRDRDPIAYTRLYRLNLHEFGQEGWRGDCNDFANVMAEVGWSMGYPMAIVSMWPARWQDRLTRDWHQIAVLCLKEDRFYLIFEFERAIWWRGTLEEYAQSQDKSIIPVGGVLSWRPTKNNPVARFADHLRLNERLRENSKPLPPPPHEPMA